MPSRITYQHSPPSSRYAWRLPARRRSASRSARCTLTSWTIGSAYASTVVWRIEKTSGIAIVQPRSTLARTARPRHASRPARVISRATRSTSVSCGSRRARFFASVSASTAMPASVRRSVSWPSGPRSRCEQARGEQLDLDRRPGTASRPSGRCRAGGAGGRRRGRSARGWRAKTRRAWETVEAQRADRASHHTAIRATEPFARVRFDALPRTPPEDLPR